MLKQMHAFLFLVASSTTAYAWLCPNSFTEIQPGDTIERIEAVCGKPLSEKKTQGGYRGPQEWQYFVTITQPLMGSGATSGSSPSVKMSVAFVENKVINITVQGTSLASTSICGPTINVGDSDKSVEKNCGKPTFIQKQDDDKSKPIEIMEYKYNTTPPNTLVFENGILKERK